MSIIGLSPTDLVTFPTLAWNLYVKCRDSKKGFESVEGLVESLDAYLEEFGGPSPGQQRDPRRAEILTSTLTMMTALNEDQRTRLKLLRGECRKVRDDLDALRKKYSSLGTDNPRKRDRVQWPADEVEALSRRLVSSTVILASFNATVVSCELQQKVDVLLAERNKEKRFSILSTPSVSSTDGEAWRQVRRELEAFGLSATTLNEHRELVINSVAQAIARVGGSSEPQLPEAETIAVDAASPTGTDRLPGRRSNEPQLRLHLISGPSPEPPNESVSPAPSRTKTLLWSGDIPSRAGSIVHKVFTSGTEYQQKKRLVQMHKRQLSARDVLQNREITILLLDQEEGGNSTMLEQMAQKRANEYKVRELRSFKPIIFSHIIQTIQTIVDTMGSAFDPQTQEHFRRIISQRPRQVKADTLPECVGTAINKLWADPRLHRAFREYKTIASAVHYFTNIDRIAAPHYTPTPSDILYATTTTTSRMTERKLIHRGLSYRFLDVEWPRSPAKGWTACFEQAHAIMYCVDISRYDEGRSPLLHLQAELDRFGAVCNMTAFRDTPVLLYLSGKERFWEKIPEAPLRDYLADYRGPINDPSSALLHIKARFLSLNKHPESRIIYPECARSGETEQFEFVKKSFKCIFLNDNMAHSIY